MTPPVFRIILVDNETGEMLKRVPLDYAMSSSEIFSEDNWPLDAESRVIIPTPSGRQLEIRIRRIL